MWRRFLFWNHFYEIDTWLEEHVQFYINLILMMTIKILWQELSWTSFTGDFLFPQKLNLIKNLILRCQLVLNFIIFFLIYLCPHIKLFTQVSLNFNDLQDCFGDNLSLMSFYIGLRIYRMKLQLFQIDQSFLNYQFMH